MQDAYLNDWSDCFWVTSLNSSVCTVDVLSKREINFFLLILYILLKLNNSKNIIHTCIPCAMNHIGVILNLTLGLNNF